jgi:CRP/FNR family transcriptional regulator, cyclic AMP receptor protein
MVESIEQELAATRMFRNLTPEQTKAVAELGEEVEVADGRAVMVEGDPADSFFLIRDGFVALEIQAPSGTITIETLHNGDPVGWSWLFEPYLTHFDARSRGVTRAIKFDAAALRQRCAEDAQLGYELMRSFTSVIVERLHATRLQLLDVYGGVGAS